MPLWAIAASVAYLYVVIGTACGWRWLASLHWLGLLCVLAVVLAPFGFYGPFKDQALITYVYSVRG